MDTQPSKGKIDLPDLVEPPCWEIGPPDFQRFLCELPGFAPSGSVLCVEDVDTSEIQQYLSARPGPFENETNKGFLKLQPKIYFMPISEENLRGLARLSERYAEPEVCSHLRIYRGEEIVLSWHDLPFDPFYVARN
jgi:hypothetical protein